MPALPPHDCLYPLGETKKSHVKPLLPLRVCLFPLRESEKAIASSPKPLPETPEAPRKGQPGPPQSFLAMDFIPRGSFSSLSLTVCSLPCLIQAYVCISGPFERAGGAGELCSFERAGEAGELCSLPFSDGSGCQPAFAPGNSPGSSKQDQSSLGQFWHVV